MTAQWSLISYAKDFDYTGGEQTWSAPYVGYYKLEVWGAQGASANVSADDRGGFGGYAIGISNFMANAQLYVNIGGTGDIVGADSGCSTRKSAVGGYNGGGAIISTCQKSAGGGGATHIATVSGQLKNLSLYKDSAGVNISKEILIVASGGGGVSNIPGIKSCHEAYLENIGDGGGAQSKNIFGFTNNLDTHCNIIYGANQNGPLGTDTYTFASVYHNEVGSFGKGGDAMGEGSFSSAGGGGWYGGASGFGYGSGAGGSGYIGSSNLISGLGVTKHMTCYSCTTSTAVATRTNSNTTTPTSTPTADVARIGNGYARITWMGDTL